MQKVKKPVCVAVMLLAISGLLATGAAYLYMSDTQTITQNISSQVVAFASDTLQLPNGAPQTPCSTRFNGALSANTTIPNVQLELLCENPVLLQGVYDSLTLTLYNAGGDTSIGSLNLLMANTLSTLISSTGEHWFDYTVAYTIKAGIAGTYSIQLKAQVISP